jgi:hypothetical protein
MDTQKRIDRGWAAGHTNQLLQNAILLQQLPRPFQAPKIFGMPFERVA